MFTLNGEQHFGSDNVHSHVTGLNVALQMDEAHKAREAGELVDQEAIREQVDAFRGYLGRIGTLKTARMTEDIAISAWWAGVAPQMGQGELLTDLDDYTLAQAVHSHVDRIAYEQMVLDETHDGRVDDFAERLELAIANGSVHPSALLGVENVRASDVYIRDRHSVTAEGRRVRAFMTTTGETHIGHAYDPTGRQRTWDHEGLHHAADSRADVGAEDARAAYLAGLLRFPLGGRVAGVDHVWIEEGSDQLDTIAVGHGQYDPRRVAYTGQMALWRTLLDEGGPFVREDAGISRYGRDRAISERLQAKVDLYQRLSRITVAAGLGNLTDLERATRGMTDYQTEVYYFEQAGVITPGHDLSSNEPVEPLAA